MGNRTLLIEERQQGRRANSLNTFCNSSAFFRPLKCVRQKGANTLALGAPRMYILDLQKATRDDCRAPTTLEDEHNSLAPSRNVEFHGDTKPLLANLRKDAGDFWGDCSQINMFPAPLDLFRQNSLDKR